MESKRSSPQQRPSRAVHAVRAGLAAIISLVAVASLATGCLDRPVAPQEPNTSNIFVDQSVRAAIDRIDLLFMIDNSASMQDKQVLLAQAVPVLLNRLLNPPCLDKATGAFASEAGGPSVACPNGTEREFPPVPDVHIAIVSSSLGGHGNPDFCEGTPQLNDFGHLISAERRPGEEGVDLGYTGMGFLAWDNRPQGDPRKANPPGDNDLNGIVNKFRSFVLAVGEDGCGYEASLESWYRFLIDPAPPQAVVRVGDVTERQGVDQVILDQRKAFLRPDSLVAIIMLTDENDCSIQDSGYGWLAGKTTLNVGTSACAANPNDKCCTYCGFQVAPEGCPALETDPACAGSDNFQNVRCWDQKRRFGVNFLYPTSRYSTALDSVEICPNSSFPDADCACRRAQELGRLCDPGTPVRNPLYTDLVNTVDVPVPAERDPSLVFLAGIIGVPWQDLATEDTLDQNVPELRFKRATELDWELIYGGQDSADSAGTPPTDTLMVESVAPRLDNKPHPITNVAPADPSSSSPSANPINGHEWNPQNNEDLQYACVFDLAPVLQGATRDCNQIAQQTCDCFDTTEGLEQVNARKKPLCHSASGYSAVQVRAKAYPGRRHLDVLRRYQANAIVASICPKVLSGVADTNPNYGYNPAVGAIIDRLKEKLGGRCLPRRLSPDPNTGEVPCTIIEALGSDRYNITQGCPPGRLGIDRNDPQGEKLDAAVRGALERSNKCGTNTGISCNDFLLCEIQQLQGAQLQECQNNTGEILSTYGYCYVAATADQKLGNPELLSDCPESEKRILRFVGANVPAQGALTFIACAGDTFSRASSEVTEQE